MARKQIKRLRPIALKTDENSFTALRAMTDYVAANAAYSLESIAVAYDELKRLQQAEAHAAAIVAAARERAVAGEWEFHNLMLGAKDQVKAQYGKDSNEVQALGLKKKSEYKSPGRRKPPPTQEESEEAKST